MLDSAAVTGRAEDRSRRVAGRGAALLRFVVDRLDAGDDVGDVEELVIDQEMLGELLAARRRTLERHQYAGLELRPRPLELGHAQPVADPPDLLAHRRDELDDLLRSGAGIDAEDAAVAIAVREGVDRVDETAPLADFLKEPRRHAAAERRVEDGSGVVIGIGIGETGKAEHDMDLLEVALLAQLATDIMRRLGARGARPRQLGEGT